MARKPPFFIHAVICCFSFAKLTNMYKCEKHGKLDSHWCEECQDVVTDKDSIIEEQKTIIVISEKEVVNVGAMLDSAEKQIKQQKELQELADKNINNLEKQNKKLRTKSTVGKVLTGVGIIGGIILGANL